MGRASIRGGIASRRCMHRMYFISCLKGVLRTPALRTWARSFAALLPRPLRFLAVGGLGLATNVAVFTIVWMFGIPSLTAGLLALVTATILTWRLNRAFTFDRTGRPQREEAMRYAVVTAVAQGTSYAVFVVLVLTVLARLPQAAIVAGAAVGALISYNGHRLFAFAPCHAEASGTAGSSGFVQS
jgi:putative flippase GtrA